MALRTKARSSTILISILYLYELKAFFDLMLFVIYTRRIRW